MLDKTKPTTRTDITDRELTALLRVRRDLENGKITNKQFIMDVCRDDLRGCGTVGCIGGWMSIYMGMTERDGVAYVGRQFAISSSLKPLFYGYDEFRGGSIGPAEAAEAITRFLDGKHPWCRVTP